MEALAASQIYEVQPGGDREGGHRGTIVTLLILRLHLAIDVDHEEGVRAGRFGVLVCVVCVRVCMRLRYCARTQHTQTWLVG